MQPFKKNSITLFFFIPILYSYIGYSQTIDKSLGFATQVTELIKNYYDLHPAENIHLSTDKQYYVAGETIWIQAFMSYENPTLADSLSTVLYVELINSQKQIVKKVLLKIERSNGRGFITIPEDMASDHYHLRAYTSWLRNLGEFAFARLPLVILHPDEPILTDDVELTNRLQIHFTPEGGRLVKHLPTKVAFFATDGYGRPRVVEGMILDSKGVNYGKFSSNEQGMGAFRIMPNSVDALQAIVQLPDGSNKVFDLPKVQNEGLVLSTTLLGKDSIRLQIQHNLNALSDGSQRYFIVAQAQGEIYFIGESSLQSKKITTFIPKFGLPEGILYLMILSDQGKLEAERLIYVDTQSDLSIAVQTSQKTYQPRESVSLEITTQDPEEESVPALLMVSVVDVAQNEPLPLTHSIESSLWFTSQLLESPANPAYFLQPNPEARQDLDTWLITQKFARFRWDDLWTSKNAPWQFPVERGITLTGKILEKKSDIPVADANILAIYGENQLSMAISDEKGNFLIDGLQFAGQDTITLFTQKGKERNTFTINFTPQASPDVTILPVPLKNPEVLPKNLSMRQIFLNWEKALGLADKDAIMLNEVMVKEKKEKPKFDRVAFQHPSGNINRVIEGEQLKHVGTPDNLLFLLNGRVPSVQVIGSHLDPKFLFRGMPVGVCVVLDGIPVEPGFLAGMHPTQIEWIEAYTTGSRIRAAWHADQSAACGVGIIISTKKDENGEPVRYFAPNKDLAKITLQGFCEDKKIVTPDYTKDKTSQMDVRATVYWQGDVQTDENGKANLSFFAADLPTTYRIVVQGVAENGQLAGQQHKEITIAK